MAENEVCLHVWGLPDCFWLLLYEMKHWTTPSYAMKFKAGLCQKKEQEIHVWLPVAQSVERATPGEEILGSITAVAARSLSV